MAKIIGRGAPTSKTYGILGQEYMDKLTGKRYICIKSATVTSDKAGEADHHCEWIEESVGGGASSWNDLKDKPFSDDTPESITWDGEIDDKETIILPDDIGIFVKVSDTPFPKESIIGGKITFTTRTVTRAAMSPSDRTFAITEDTIFVDEGVIAIMDNQPSSGNLCVLISELDGAAFPFGTINRGVYFIGYGGEYCSKLTFAPQVKKLDEKYLPELGMMRINITNDGNGNYHADKTFIEIHNAVSAGKLPYVRNSGEVIFLTECGDSELIFTKIGYPLDTTAFITSVDITSHDQVIVSHHRVTVTPSE